MSRRNYINSLDVLIGKPYYSNAAGAVIDPSTGTEVPTTTFRAEEVPTNEYLSTPPIASIAVAENSDLEGIRIQEERRKLEAERLASLTEAEKALRQQRIELAKVKNEQRLAKREAEKQAILNNPVVVVAKPYVAPPLIISGGGGGGGGSMEEPSMPKPASTVVSKPSFLKKNFVPLLLVASAIFVFIKNPIK